MKGRREDGPSGGRFFPRWAASRWPYMLFLLAAIGLSALVIHLYRVPPEAGWYAAEIALALLLALAVWDYWRARARHRALGRLMGALPESLSHLPEAASPVEADYQALLGAMAEQRRAALTREDRRYRALEDYVLRFSHEVKTPIAAGRLLLRRVPDAERLALQEELFSVERQVDMMLSFFKLEGGMDDFIFAPCALRQLAARAVRRYARFFVLKKLALQIDIPEDLEVRTDAKLLQFVLEQLISNAVKYTQEGGVRLCWREEDRSLLVRDTGPGIAPEDLPRVTDQGYTGRMGRVHQQATGMGLYLSRMACRRLGVALSIASAPGEGTEVSLRFGREPDPQDR